MRDDGPYITISMTNKAALPKAHTFLVGNGTKGYCSIKEKAQKTETSISTQVIRISIITCIPLPPKISHDTQEFHYNIFQTIPFNMPINQQLL